MDMDPLDLPPEDYPNRQKTVIGSAVATFVESLSVLCGEHFLTHDEHQSILDMTEEPAKRWLERNKTLDDLDF